MPGIPGGRCRTSVAHRTAPDPPPATASERLFSTPSLLPKTNASWIAHTDSECPFLTAVTDGLGYDSSQLPALGRSTDTDIHICACSLTARPNSLTVQYADTFDKSVGNSVYAPGAFLFCWCLHVSSYDEIPWVPAGQWTTVVLRFATNPSRAL